MKYMVTVAFQFDTDEYGECPNTPEGAQELAMSMLKGDADLPDDREIKIYRVNENQS